MKAIEFPGVNEVYAKGRPEETPCIMLPCPDHAMITCYELTDEEVAEIFNTKRLYLKQTTICVLPILNPVTPSSSLDNLF